MKRLQHLHVGLQVRVAHVLDHVLRGLLRVLVPPLLRAREGDEVHVVGPVHQRIHAGRAGAFYEGAVRLRGLHVALGHQAVVARLQKDVARHVDEVARGRHQRQEACRARDGALEVGRGFDRVDVEVVRAGVVRVPSHHRLEHRDELLRSRRRLAVGGPELPRPQHHQALSEHRGEVEVVRILLHQVAHGVAVVEVQPLPVRLRVGRRVALRQGAHVVRLDRAPVRETCESFLDGVVRGGRARLGHLGVVVVRADGEREPPVRHGRRGIELRGAAEVPGGLVVVEAVEKREALVEVLLRLRVLRLDGVAMAPHPRLDLGRRHGRSGAVVVLGGRGRRERRAERDGS